MVIKYTKMNTEFAELLEKYITTDEIKGIDYFILTMKEYNIIETYRCDKYSMLEIFQDIDQINLKHNKKTNYYNTFYIPSKTDFP